MIIVLFKWIYIAENKILGRLANKMNVLVYAGPGTTTESVKHCLETLRLHLSPYNAVTSISENSLLNDPWMYKTSLLVLPGGADLPFCRSLNGDGNRKISQFVKKGGKFIGFCAGGYYSSSRVEFEVGDAKMEVSGSRELGFFPGIAKGCAYKGFMYESHGGAKATKLAVNTKALPNCVSEAYNYYNGGCVFLNASKYSNVEILARYTEPLDVEDEEKAAAIYCKVGKGDVLLTGSHPEFTPLLLSSSDGDRNFQQVIDTLNENDFNRRVFMKECLKKLGLRVNDDVNTSIPKITPIYLLSNLNPTNMTQLMSDLKENLDFVNGNTFEDNHDTFSFHEETEEINNYTSSSENEIEDPHAAIKHIKVFTSKNLPSSKETPYFDMSTYFETLAMLSKYSGKVGDFGSVIGYGEVVSSTNAMLESNPHLLRYLPNGFTLAATTQVAGRGRGGNVWINPKGVMAQSILFKISSGQNQSSSIVTLQYLCGLALIELILGYGSIQPGNGAGYEDLPVKIKWPNDIFALKPEYFNSLEDKNEFTKTVDGDDEKYAKISGALINSQFLNNQFHLVWGVGVNVSNSAPTTSLNLVLARLNEIREKNGLKPLPPFKHEILLAKLMYTIDQFYNVFKHSGIKPFLPLYYKRWFHTSQIVKLDAHGNGQTRTCIIRGITSDYGLLIAEDINNGETLELQPDGNSFDIFKGLVYKKT